MEGMVPTNKGFNKGFCMKKLILDRFIVKYSDDDEDWDDEEEWEDEEDEDDDWDDNDDDDI